MAPLIMPRWQGQTWPVKRTPVTSTRVARHVSGREVRSPSFVTPLYQFEIAFEGLSSDTRHPGLAERSLHELQGFYLACGGALTPFLFIDQVDHFVRGQALGVGDGSTTVWPFLRAIGTKFVEPVSWVTNVAAITVGGVPFNSVPGAAPAWSLAQPASLIFSVPPPLGAIILADFSYAFLCRFSDDSVDFDLIMDGIWSNESLKFQTFR